MQHHAAVYGFWATAVGNYYQHKILQRPTHPRMHELYAIEDPYFYLDKLTMPKYIVNGSGDQFFCPDSSQFYFDDLKGEKHLRYVPNADHGVDNSIDAVTSMVAFYQMIIADRPRPEIDWTFEEDGSIRVTSDTPPKSVMLWQAANPNARDFRVETIGKAYQSTPLTAEADGSYVAKVDDARKRLDCVVRRTRIRLGRDVPLQGLDQRRSPSQDAALRRDQPRRGSLRAESEEGREVAAPAVISTAVILSGAKNPSSALDSLDPSLRSG